MTFQIENLRRAIQSRRNLIEPFEIVDKRIRSTFEKLNLCLNSILIFRVVDPRTSVERAIHGVERTKPVMREEQSDAVQLFRSSENAT